MVTVYENEDKHELCVAYLIATSLSLYSDRSEFFTTYAKMASKAMQMACSENLQQPYQSIFKLPSSLLLTQRRKLIPVAVRC
jgi:hypothetical protein